MITEHNSEGDDPNGGEAFELAKKQAEALSATPEIGRPTDSVRVVIFDADESGRFLVLTEADDPDNWKLPGGKFNHTEGRNESPDEAAARELAEELGVSTEEVNLKVSAELLNDDEVSARYIYYGTAASKVSPTDEIAQVGWFTEATLPDTKNRGHILSAVTAARQSIEADSQKEA
jgi:ADP-ribose pyrophosphatase YjhB (NUDIX family)